MRRGILGSIAALAAGAGAAWGQAPAPVGPAGGTSAASLAGSVIPASGPAPVIMPPIAVGPPGDPQGLGPTASLGPPPGPMYPPPGPYGAPLFQPPPGGPGGPGGPGADGCTYAAPHWWFDGEYLLWFAKGQPINFPLLTTSAPNANGVIGFPSTIQLVRGEDIDYSAISGFRLSGGFFGDADRRFGAFVTGFYTEQKGVEKRFATSPTGLGIPLLARPFIDTNGGFSSLVVADTQFGNGSAIVATSTSTWGIEANGVWNLFRTNPEAKSWHSLDYIFGYKFLQNQEDLRIDSFTTLAGLRTVPIFVPGPFGTPIVIGTRIIPTLPPVPVGGVTASAPATVQVSDRFRATNRFNGGVIGLHHEYRHGMWSVNTTGKLGIGNMHQVLEIEGGTAFANPLTGANGASYGGLFANSTNIGRWNNDEFALIPELTVNFGVNVTKSITMYIGYNYLYISRVIRPGGQINPVVDSTTVPFSPNFGATGGVLGTRRLFVQDDFWLQGVNFGMQVRY